MPLWLIERDVSGWSEADIEAAAIRAKICVLWYEDMAWIRSFLDEAGGKTFCIYEARSAEDLRIHASNAGLPCDAVTPISEVLPENIGTSAREEVA